MFSKQEHFKKEPQRLKSYNYSRGLLLILLILFGLGLVQVYSSSYIFAIEKFDNGFLFFQKQLIFTFLSIGVLFVMALIPPEKYQKWGWVFWGLFSLGTILTFVPPMGVSVSGAYRWLELPFSFRVQPSEFLKVGFALLVAHYLNIYYAHRQQQVPLSQVGWSWFFKWVVLIVPLICLLHQPDFGAFILLSSVGLTLLFVVGFPQKYLLGLIAVFLMVAGALILKEPYRIDRVLAFINPWEFSDAQGMQLLHSLLGFFKGGLTGLGLGLGQNKLLFLPEAHTDFTLSVLAEETGFLGVSILMILYGTVILQGFKIVSRTSHLYQKTLALCLMLIFTYSVFINVGVVVGLLPTKGLTLPFLSYGGSSLLSQGFLFGILFSIDRQNRKDEKGAERRSEEVKGTTSATSESDIENE